MTRFHLKSLVLAVLALGAVAAQADTVSVAGYQFGLPPAGSPLSVTATVAGVTRNSSGAFGTADEPAGAFTTSVNGGASFLSYCLDLTQSAPVGSSDSSYSRVSGGSYSFANASAASSLSKLFTVAGSQVNSISSAAAFQLAVWEIVYEAPANAYSVLTGNAIFGVQDSREIATLTQANFWLNALSNTPATAPISILSSTDRQDLVYGGATAPIPEPSTYALMFAGLGALGFVARRRSNKQA